MASGAISNVPYIAMQAGERALIPFAESVAGPAALATSLGVTAYQHRGAIAHYARDLEWAAGYGYHKFKSYILGKLMRHGPNHPVSKIVIGLANIRRKAGARTRRKQRKIVHKRLPSGGTYQVATLARPTKDEIRSEVKLKIKSLLDRHRQTLETEDVDDNPRWLKSRKADYNHSVSAMELAQEEKPYLMPGGAPLQISAPPSVLNNNNVYPVAHRFDQLPPAPVHHAQLVPVHPAAPQQIVYHAAVKPEPQHGSWVTPRHPIKEEMSGACCHGCASGGACSSQGAGERPVGDKIHPKKKWGHCRPTHRVTKSGLVWHEKFSKLGYKRYMWVIKHLGKQGYRESIIAFRALYPRAPKYAFGVFDLRALKRLRGKAKKNYIRDLKAIQLRML